MLLLHSLGRSSSDRAWLLAHDDDALPLAASAAFNQLTLRRLAGEPVAYITGRKAFYGLDLQVSPAVLDPRADTEILVDWVLDCLADGLTDCLTDCLIDPPRNSTPQVLDLGTGSGAIALAIKAHAPQAQVTAVDASAAALAVAAGNAQRLGLDVAFLQGSWLAPVAGQRFDVIVSNPPYIAPGDPHLAALQYEPWAALVAQDDGLSDIRHIIATAPLHLRPGACLLLEHGFDQGAAVAALLQASGFTGISQRHDLAGHIRCTGGKMAPSA